jgi:hypothetical protein
VAPLPLLNAHVSAPPCLDPSRLSAEDLKHVMTSIGEKLTVAQAEQMLTEADVDGKGKLNCAPAAPAGCASARPYTHN